MRQCCRTSLLWIKARYSTFLRRYPGPYPGWSRMMQSVCDGIYPGQSTFLSYPWQIIMDPTNMSCIFLHSSLALRYGATPVLIFDQPCGGKPWRLLTMSHLTVSHDPLSYGLGDCTQKWAFLAAWDDWRQDQAFNNCWKWSLLRILSHTCWLARPSPEQFEDIFLQMLSLMLNSIECE